MTKGCRSAGRPALTSTAAQSRPSPARKGWGAVLLEAVHIPTRTAASPLVAPHLVTRGTAPGRDRAQRVLPRIHLQLTGRRLFRVH